MTDATPAPAPAPSPAPASDQPPAAGGDAAQFRGLVLDGLARGFIDRAVATKELTDAGYLPLSDDEAANPPALPDVDGARKILQAAKAEVEGLPPGFEPGKSADFKLPNVNELNFLTAPKDGGPVHDLTATETMHIQGAVGGWMEEAGLPAPIGSAVATMAGDHLKSMPHWGQMEQGAQDAYSLGQRAKLEKLWGAEAGKKIERARAVVQRVEAKRPGLVAFLERTGLGSNANVITQLAMHGERLAAAEG